MNRHRYLAASAAFGLTILGAGAAAASPACDTLNSDETYSDGAPGGLIGTVKQGEKIHFSSSTSDTSAVQLQDASNGNAVLVSLGGTGFNLYTVPAGVDGHTLAIVFAPTASGQSHQVVARCISIDSVTPLTGTPGSTVTITGGGFYPRGRPSPLSPYPNPTGANPPGSVDQVMFGSTPATSFTVNSNSNNGSTGVTTITAVVPNTPTGPISVAYTPLGLSSTSSGAPVFTLAVVPTLTEWAMIGLTALLGGAGLAAVVRRRRSPA